MIWGENQRGQPKFQILRKSSDRFNIKKKTHINFTASQFGISSLPGGCLATSEDVSVLSLGEGNGTPLQYSCLEIPMDGGAWWAAVHGVTEGQTRLSDFPFTFHFHALEKKMVTHSSALAWRIPGTGEPGWAAIYGVTQSWTRLKRLSSSSSIITAAMKLKDAYSLEGNL